jgi:hypothetical protein
MLVYRPTTGAPLARYYYLPATDAKPAEIIQVINSRGITVEVPMREEDAVLTSFFERRLTPGEQQAFQDRESWKVFVAWEELEQDHLDFEVAEEDWLLLIKFKNRYTLKEGMAV